MKKITLLSLVLIATLAFIGCETTDNTNMKVNGNTLNKNMGAVVNDNANVVAPNANMNKELTREEFDKDKAKYEAEAKDSKNGKYTYGQGANDAWILTKTRLAFLAASDLRESTIDVDVTNDKITLKGTVATAAEKTKAEEVAKGIEGQKGITNQLRVDAKDSMTNQMTSDNSKEDKMENANKAKSDK